jgi:hypothetical protein
MSRWETLHCLRLTPIPPCKAKHCATDMVEPKYGAKMLEQVRVNVSMSPLVRIATRSDDCDTSNTQFFENTLRNEAWASSMFRMRGEDVMNVGNRSLRLAAISQNVGALAKAGFFFTCRQHFKCALIAAWQERPKTSEARVRIHKP